MSKQPVEKYIIETEQSLGVLAARLGDLKLQADRLELKLEEVSADVKNVRLHQV